MQLSAAFEEIGKKYKNGLTEFYSQMKNDPWQRAHDQLEGQMLLYKDSPDYFNKICDAANDFMQECLRLIELYAALNPEQPKLPNFADAFAIGDEEKIKKIEALANNECLICASKENVKVISHPIHGPGIYCQEHLK